MRPEPLARWILLLGLWLAAGPTHARCDTNFFNPIADVDWSCIFPMTIGPLEIKLDRSPSDPDKIDSPVCACTNGPIPRFGLKVGFWEPARMIDTVKDPYCFVPLGLQLANPAPGTLSGSNTVHEAHATGSTSAQFHWYIMPIWGLLDLFADIPCLDGGNTDFDVAMMSELLPTWNNDILAILLNPEAALFANPVSQLACTGDAAAVAAGGLPRNELFWCMGSWGSAYPLAGTLGNPEYVVGNAGLAARAIYFMARTTLLTDPGVDACGSVRTPIWRKRNYRLQPAQPVRGRCMPIGQPGIPWASNKNPPLKGDNFSWMLWRRVTCCLSY
ncbi:MAG TPA: TraU family protein [Thiohalobacter sp.]|nr:TraU family protein [Thiohalobacter sp.]